MAHGGGLARAVRLCGPSRSWLSRRRTKDWRVQATRRRPRAERGGGKLELARAEVGCSGARVCGNPESSKHIPGSTTTTKPSAPVDRPLSFRRSPRMRCASPCCSDLSRRTRRTRPARARREWSTGARRRGRMVRERRARLLGLERGLDLPGVDLEDLVGYVGGVDEHTFPRVLRQVRLRHDRPALDRVLRGRAAGPSPCRARAFSSAKRVGFALGPPDYAESRGHAPRCRGASRRGRDAARLGEQAPAAASARDVVGQDVRRIPRLTRTLAHPTDRCVCATGCSGRSCCSFSPASRAMCCR